MPIIRPIPAICYAVPAGGDVSGLIAPPYDVLDEAQKDFLLRRSPHNLVAVDLPHLPAKTVGPDEVYVQAGARFSDWVDRGILERRADACMFVYRQTFTTGGQTHRRLGLVANVPVRPLSDPRRSASAEGSIYPHEQTFSEPKEDRLKLMRATRAQLSPIFGLYHDPDGRTNQLLLQIAQGADPMMHGTTANDGVLHELWSAATHTQQLSEAMADRDVFIADGHHRYNTAVNYLNEMGATAAGPDHPARFCLFVLVSMQDPGMIVLPTHRALGGMANFNFERFVGAASPGLRVSPFDGSDLAALESALPGAGPHAMGLVHRQDGQRQLSIATTAHEDPLAGQFADRSLSWRQLDVAIVQHLIVEQVCEPSFCAPGKPVKWRFPHSLDQLDRQLDGDDCQLGLVMQATPLDAVRQVSQAGELMPQKSTFFYPKLATGLVINPVD